MKSPKESLVSLLAVCLLGFCLAMPAQPGWAQTADEPVEVDPAASEQDDTQPPDVQPELPADDTANAEADAAFADLRSDLLELQQTLRSKGGVFPEDHRILNRYLQRVQQFNQQWPDYLPGLAHELTLQMWLENDSAVDGLFERMIELAEADRADLTHAWADYYYQRGAYRRTIAILSASDPETLGQPKVALLLSQALTADNEFARANDVIDTIPADVAGTLGVEVTRQREQITTLLEAWADEMEARSDDETAGDLPRVEFQTPKGRIVVELFEDDAPNTVANFVYLVEDGFYDGVRVQMAQPGEIVMTGDPNTRAGAQGVIGAGDPGWTIADEANQPGARKHFAGSVALELKRNMQVQQVIPNTGGSQFYFALRPLPDRNGVNTVFGRIVEGLDIARQLELGDTLESVTVIRKRDHEYEPEKFDPTAGEDAPMPESPLIP